MVAFQGDHPPFKGDSPHLRPQPSRAESSPTRSKVLPLRHGGWVPRIVQSGPGQKKPNRRARRVTAQRLRAFLHFRPDQRVKGWTAMQATCNQTKGAHPFDFDASSVEAQAPTSCNRRAGCYVRATAPPLAPLPRLLDCGTSTATRGNPGYCSERKQWEVILNNQPPLVLRRGMTAEQITQYSSSFVQIHQSRCV